MKIAIVQKCPTNMNYEKLYQLPQVEVFNLSSKKVSRLLKRDVDLEGFNPNDWDFVILVGSEALSMYSKVTKVSDFTGKRVTPKEGYKDNLIASISPGMLAFKPEIKPVFDETVENIHLILKGKDKGSRDVKARGITDYKEAVQYLTEVLNRPTNVVALDSETSGLNARKSHLLGISLSDNVNEGAYICASIIGEEVQDLLEEIIYTKEHVVFHNAKFDMKFYKFHLGIDFSKVRNLHDTMVLHYALDERQGTHGLKSLTLKYGTLGDYDAELEEYKVRRCKELGLNKSDFTYDLIPFDIMYPYAAKDAIATLELFNKFYPIVTKHPQLSRLYKDLLQPMLPFLNEMEENGVPLCLDRLSRVQTYLIEHLDTCYTKLYQFPEVQQVEAEQGAKFNPNSTKQLRVLLFDNLKLPIPDKLTATGQISTDAEVLKDLAKHHEIAELILEIKKDTKLLNTYVNKLIANVDRDGRIRTSFNLTSTTSGRLSSSGTFNMQQLPRDNPIIKGCVRARPGYRIVAVDLTTAEVYYAAVLSGDKNLQQVFINMQKDPDKYPDFHSNIAHMVFNLKCDPAEVKKLYPALRQAAKAITFGILYGSGPAKVAETVNQSLIEAGEAPTCTKADAQDYINTYFSRFRRLEKWIKDSHDSIKVNGFIYNHFGRKRRLHNINSKDRGVAAGEVRSGFNAVIQSVSSDHLGLGAMDTHNELKAKKLDASIFALVHDSVVAEVREDLVSTYLEILFRNIQKDRGCSIPGYPIGLDQDTEEGGSDNYSGGKFEKMYPELVA